MAGLVHVDGQRVDKAGTQIAATAALHVKEREPYVSRAGRKLAAALDHFEVDPQNLICLDIGASTGGFTDCLLQRGARRVYAVDVGYGQLDARLRSDPRVIVMERVNARRLDPADFPEQAELAVLDVSFISLVKILPAVTPLLIPGSRLLPMIKPQFEGERHQVGKGGIVRDEEVRRSIIDRRLADFESLGLEVKAVVDNQLTGAGGNREAFALLEHPASPITVPPEASS